ncbi:MAG: MSCRAMM family adhesin SdrC [Lachnospiraceae bacterium]|nr:MSCRAMM family adhesin SdrC [Lachnospiraceae bacterium]
MKGKQIPLSERIRRTEQGLAADEAASANAVQQFAALPLSDFFLDPTAYPEFMEKAQEAAGALGLGEIRTYLDAVKLMDACLRSSEDALWETGNQLVYSVSINCLDMCVVLRGLNDEQYRESMHDTVKEECVSLKPFKERLRSMPSGRTEQFPILHLPVRQLYQGVSALTGNGQPDKFYIEVVLPCVAKTLAEKTNMRDTVADMGYCGWIAATHPDSDDADDLYDLSEYEDDGTDDDCGDIEEDNDSVYDDSTDAEDSDGMDDDCADAEDSNDMDDDCADAEDSDSTDDACVDAASNDDTGGDEAGKSPDAEYSGNCGCDAPEALLKNYRLTWYIAIAPYLFL